MKEFYKFSEALLLSVKPSSDAVAPAEPCSCQKPDGFTSAANDYVKNVLGGGEETVQPDDNVGETGDIEFSSESSGGVELECMGEDGLKIKLNGMEIVLPKDVVEAIKNYEGSESEEHKEHEDSETPEEESEEHETQPDNEEKTEEVATESVKKGKAVNAWAVCNKSTGGQKKVGKSKFERCVKNVKKTDPIKK